MIMSSSIDSSSGSQHPQLPPGYRFHPTDEELVVHYLKKKIASAPLPVAIIAEVDLYKFDPWELPAKATFGEHEWYFFSPRDRKYPNGARPNRAATSGYWKATGTDKPILTAGGTQKIAVKKALVFYRGKPPKGIKTNWIMHEYRLIDNNNNNNNAVMQPPGVKKNSTRLDNWVLCRIYKKHNSQRPIEFEKQAPPMVDRVLISPSTMGHRRHNLEMQETKHCGLFLDNNDPFFEGLLSDNATLSHQFASNKPEAAATTSVTLQSDPNYWNEATGGDSSTSTTKNVSVLPNNQQIPQHANSAFHHQVLLGSLGDGVYTQQYQVSGINWSS